MTPNEGPADTIITLRGVNFGDSQGEKVVSLNRRNVYPLEIRLWSDSEIQAVVPSSLPPGEYGVMVYYDSTYLRSSTWRRGVSNRFWITIPPEPVALPPFYRLTDLGAVCKPATEFGSRARSINNAGQVAGLFKLADGGDRPFLYSPGRCLKDIAIASGGAVYPYGHPGAVNHWGQVAVNLYGGDGRGKPFLYDPGTDSLTPLGSLTDYPYGFAYAIAGITNRGDSVVGEAVSEPRPGVYDTVAFVSAGGEMRSLGRLGGLRACATGINRFGEIVGWSQTDSTPSSDYWNPGRAFLHTDRMRDLNEMIDPALGMELRKANAINELGLIVGYGWVGDRIHAFRYYGRLHDIGSFPDGGYSYALGINFQGDVVGAAYLDATGVGNFRAFVYSDRFGLHNLNDLIDPSLGWVLREATGINDRGQIVGWAEVNGQERAFLLTPVYGDTISSQSGR
jgi:probable HAF family extracellular repeat protein